MLATLSGCQKEEETPNELNPISRLEAEQLLKGWNAERKSTLKSTATIALSEKQWQKAKVYQNDSIQISVISVPLAQRLALCFEKGKQGTGLFFCEARPDSLYLTEKQGKVEPKSFTGYLILYNNEGKGVVAYRYVNGIFEDEYGVAPKQSLLKGVNDMNYIDEVVVTAKRPEKYHDENTPFIPNFPDLSKCFIKKDADTNIGSSISIGGTTSNPTPDPTPEVDTPCAKVQAASTMPGLPDKLAQLLKDAKSLSYETGYMVDNRYNYTYKTGPIGDCKVPVGVSTFTVAILHSHPGMCGNMFSPGDIKVIWDLCQGNAIIKTDFQLGLVTSTGKAYFLSVSNYSKFEAFANKWNMSSNDISGLKNLFETNYYDESWSSSLLESKFLDFIRDAGLTMLKGDTNSSSSWNALQKDTSGNITNTPCNN